MRTLARFVTSAHKQLSLHGLHIFISNGDFRNQIAWAS